jgi:hypothetical protein
MEVSGQRHSQAALYPPGKTPSNQRIRGWLGLSAGLDTKARGKDPFPGLEPRPSSL